MIAASGLGQAQTSTEGTTADQDSTPQAVARSPWLATPLLSSNPKFGTSIGGLVGYLYKFDRESPVSMFGLTASYSDTDSYKLVLFANTYFDEDRQRINAAVIYGNIENDYEDFLGTGQQSQTTDKIDLYFLRYLYRFSGNWFIGAQGVMTNLQLFVCHRVGPGHTRSSGSGWFSVQRTGTGPLL